MKAYISPIEKKSPSPCGWFVPEGEGTGMGVLRKNHNKGLTRLN
jgi:hypothetical protein